FVQVHDHDGLLRVAVLDEPGHALVVRVEDPGVAVTRLLLDGLEELRVGEFGEQLEGEVLCGAVRIVVHHAYTVSDSLTISQARILVTWDTGLRGGSAHHAGAAVGTRALEIGGHRIVGDAGVDRVPVAVPGSRGGRRGGRRPKANRGGEPGRGPVRGGGEWAEAMDRRA